MSKTLSVLTAKKRIEKMREITQKNNFFLHSGHIGEKRGKNFNK